MSVKIGTFIEQRQVGWDRLDSLIGTAKGRPERLPAADILLLGRLYRSSVADLARIKASYPTYPVAARLEGLVLRARPLVYRSEARGLRPLHFVVTDFWRIATERPVFLGVAAVALLGTAALGLLWAVLDSSAAIGMVPGEFAAALDPAGGTDMGADLAMQAEFSAFLITHNITVAILAFAVGIFFGVGTVLVLVQNGLLLGVIAGVLITGDGAGFFVELTAAHGILELSCIVVAGAAGLRLGWALLSPGIRTRREALAAEARPAVLTMLGIVPWLVIAGVIEAFVSRRGIAAVPMAVVGLVVGAVFWLLMWRRGGTTQPPVV